MPSTHFWKRLYLSVFRRGDWNYVVDSPHGEKRLDRVFKRVLKAGFKRVWLLFGVKIVVSCGAAPVDRHVCSPSKRLEVTSTRPQDGPKITRL
jgi:hypothetical protein